MDQVTANLIQAAISNNTYDSSLQETQLKLTGTDYVRTAYSSTLGLWVSVGANGIVATSRNNTDWDFTCITTNQLYDVKFANGLFVAVGASSTVFTSTNGYDWIQRSFPIASLTLTEVVFGNNTWVISCYTSSQQIFTSSDAITWILKWSTSATFNGSIRYYPLTYYATNIWMTILGGQVFTSTDGTTWTLRPISSDVIFSHVHYTGSLWLAAGALVTNSNSIVLANSTDGITWSATYTISTTSSTRILTSNGTNVLIGTSANNIWASLDNGLTGTFVTTGQAGGTATLVYGNSKWVLTSGGSGDVLNSTNGITWTKPVASGFGVTNVMIYANSLFVSGSTGGVIKTSTDGITWTTQTSNATTSILDIKFFNGTFVAVTTTGGIRTSTTGTGSWSSQTSPTSGAIIRISYGNGLWVAVGNGVILTSSDAVTWNITSLASNYSHVEYNNGVWVAYGSSNTIIRSTTGTSWTFVKRDLQQPRSIGFGNNTWTAVGAGGEITTSTDLTNWTFQTSGTTNQLNHVTYKNNLWCAVGNSGTLVTSTDASTWTYRNLSGTSNSNFNQIDYGNAVWAACGSSGAIIRSTGNTSNANIATWTTATSGVSAPLFGIVYNSGSSWTVSGNWGYILSSSNDASTWTSRTSLGTLTHPITGLNSVAFGAGVFVAVGASGTIISSTDGLNWTSRTSNTSNQFRKIIFANTYFVAVGDSGTIRTSTDGTTWASHTSGTANQLLDVGFGNGRWTVVGASGTIISNNDLTNLTSWTAATSVGHTQTINCVLYANNIWVTGNAGNVVNIRYASDPTGTWTAATGTTNNISVADIAYGNSVFVTASTTAYTSTNGITWTAVTTGGLNTVFNTYISNYVNYVNNKFIAFYIHPSLTGSFRPIFTSKNGTDWINIGIEQKALSLQDIAYGNNKYVVVGKHTATLGFIGYSAI